MIRERTPSPYDPPKTMVSDQQFRVGVIPLMFLEFFGLVAILYGFTVVSNVFRDAMNGYDSQYIVLASLLPALLCGFGSFVSLQDLNSCVVAGRQR